MCNTDVAICDKKAEPEKSRVFLLKLHVALNILLEMRYTYTSHLQPVTHSAVAVGGPLIPYGLPCVRELFRFLVSLTNPLDRHNSDVMIHMGLSLLTVALESGADHIPANSSLMCLVRDDMCKNLIFVSHTDTTAVTKVCVIVVVVFVAFLIACRCCV